jgi:hypothetical protein
MGAALSQPETDAVLERLRPVLAAGTPSVTVSFTFNGSSAAPAPAVEPCSAQPPLVHQQATDQQAADQQAADQQATDQQATDQQAIEQPESSERDQSEPSADPSGPTPATSAQEADDELPQATQTSDDDQEAADKARSDAPTPPIDAAEDDDLTMGHVFESRQAFKLRIAREELTSRRTLRRLPASTSNYVVVCSAADCGFMISINPSNCVVGCKLQHTCEPKPRTIQEFLLVDMLRHDGYDLTKDAADLRKDMLAEYGSVTPQLATVRRALAAAKGDDLRVEAVMANGHAIVYHDDRAPCACNRMATIGCACATQKPGCGFDYMCHGCYMKHVLSVAYETGSASKRRAY